LCRAPVESGRSDLPGRLLAAQWLSSIAVFHSGMTMTPRSKELAPMPTPVTMYSTRWCGYCRNLKSQMEREGISYVEVDIEQDPEAADLVMQLNGGNQTVPTVVFPDGSAVTNPSLREVKARLVSPN
jgi:mycoredoxin